MKNTYLTIIVLFVSATLVCSTVASNPKENSKQLESESEYQQSSTSDDFYFVHITDTHIMHKIFDRGLSKNRLKSVLDKVCSFEEKPAFIVITGDLTEWGGSRISGALNCQAFASCFYSKDGQLYADSEYLTPVYTTPGNHDYCFNRNIENYNTYIDKNHVETSNRYIVTYDDVSLFFMNSGPNYYSNLSILFDWHGWGLSNDDIYWLEDELSACQSARKIILMHHPAVGEDDDVFINSREKFVELCEAYDVELVLAGHTHDSKVYDFNLNEYTNLPLNSSQLQTLYVQSDDCKDGCRYRNVTVVDNNIWLEDSQEIDPASKTQDDKPEKIGRVFLPFLYR